jgi:hypothetical protein
MVKVSEAPDADVPPEDEHNRNDARKPEAYAPKRHPVEALSHIAFLPSGKA